MRTLVRPMAIPVALLASLIIGSGGSARASVGSEVVSTFDSNLEGWTVVGDNSATWEPSGGNPDGCVSVVDLATGDQNKAAAPPKFLGDWSAMGAADTLSYELHLETNSPTFPPPWMFRIVGPGGEARGIVPGVVPPRNQWVKFQVSLDSADWDLQSGTWSELLAEVTSLEVYAEFANGPETVRIDNVRLTGVPPVVFDPCAHSTFNDGSLESWTSFQTGGVTNPGVDGNSLGYLHVLDELGVGGYLFAPARYLGDWSAFDETGALTMDLRVIETPGPFAGIAQFIRLTGPGGSARVGLAAAGFPPGTQSWTTLRFPLREAEWTVTTGTWSALLANITEVRVAAELFNGDEILGFDNFGRMMDDCPAIDAPVSLHVPDVVLSETHGFVNVHSVDRNPVDGFLYGVVAADAASGGGFYPVTGPQAGVRRVTYGNSEATQLLFDDDGDAFVSLYYTSGNVQRIAYGSTSSATWVSGFNAGDDDPWGMAFAPAGFNGTNVSEGDILVTDPGFGGDPEAIWSFSPDTAEGEKMVVGDPGDPNWYGITDGPAGTMWFTDFNADGVLTELRPDGTTVVNALTTPLTGLTAIRYCGLEGVFYVVSSNALYRLDPSTWIATLVADGFRAVSTVGLALSPDDRTLWLVDYSGDRVYEFVLPAAVAAPEIGPRLETLSLEIAPNPFANSAGIRFELPTSAVVDVAVYDVAGRKVRDRVQRRLPAGGHSIPWDGRDDQGRRSAPGLYLARLSTGDRIVTGKLIMLR